MAIILPLMLTFAKLLLLFFSQISSATDTITQSESLPDGKTLVSEDGTFELGFFTPGNSTNRYVGIWYKNIPIRTVVWVANRGNPIKSNYSSMLNMSREGNLILLSQNDIVWSTKATTANLKPSSANVIAQLLSSGNLILRDEKDDDPQSYLWQSFDYPTDTLLPGMKLGWNLKTGLNRRLIAWKNWDDPSLGDFTWEVVRSSNPEMVFRKGSIEVYRSGPWNGVRISDIPIVHRRALLNIDFVNNTEELYFTYSVSNKSKIVRFVMNQTISTRECYQWKDEAQKWELHLKAPRDECDKYNRCGPFANCAVGESPLCQCLRGFEPKSPQNRTQGCARTKTWSCRDKNKDGFLKSDHMKVPDAKGYWVNRSMTLEECKAKCWENCSCTGFANLDITVGQENGCVNWFDDLFDLRQIEGTGQTIYIRGAASETEAKDGSRKKVVVITSIISTIIVVLLIFALIYWGSKTKTRGIIITKDNNEQHEQEELELPSFDFAMIVHATDDFSSHKKLGAGGFGPVYRGTLPDGQEIAVKRLSRRSGQGLKEFKNEVIFCTKLQHRNLVKVIGCCIHEEEKLLIYEYMPNKSLDYILFDSIQSELLDWPMRFNIINGIARGLLYLHQDSRLRIIHRDLKASNVLLDDKMNPKISDFGLARMCENDQIEGNTSMVVGTYGYMAPEYAIDGLFSIKSDVFSFGILLLEIVSGKKNKGISYPNNSDNLIEHAWRLWKEGIPEELIDASIVESCILHDALRCVHIGLLCVQHHPEHRPNMTSVVVMLSSESVLPQPKEPGFLIGNVTIGESSPGMHTSSVNEVSISILDAR